MRLESAISGTHFPEEKHRHNRLHGHRGHFYNGGFQLKNIHSGIVFRTRFRFPQSPGYSRGKTKIEAYTF